MTTAGSGLAFSMASPSDLADVRSLVDASSLPAKDVADHISHFIIVRDASRLAGCIGVELSGTTGLLRSLAVAPGQRQKGLGKELCRRLEDYARSKGVTDLYLLTMDATRFFERIGYGVADRANAPSAVRSSLQFTSLCPSSAVLMVKKIW